MWLWIQHQADGSKQQWANDYSSDAREFLGGRCPTSLARRNSVVIDKLTNYASQLALIVSLAGCMRKDGIHKECLSASRKSLWESEDRCDLDQLHIGCGSKVDSPNTSKGFD